MERRIQAVGCMFLIVWALSVILSFSLLAGLVYLVYWTLATNGAFG